MNIEIITKQDLQELEKRILEAVKCLEKSSKTEKEWLRPKEVCHLLQCSSGKLINLRIKGILPFSKIGGSIYYNRKDILKVLEENQRNNG